MSAKPNNLHRIKHIVCVMLENRSFDHMLGYLYTKEGNVSPLNQPYEGLTGKETNPGTNGRPVKVFPITASHPHPYFMPGSDPGEGFLATNTELFGSYKAPPPGTPATNQGFISDYAYTLKWEQKKKSGFPVMPGTKPSDIMGSYAPEMLPVLSHLAKGYAVCDHWFCSAPTETLPNRAFLNMATSQGRLTDHDRNYTAPSIFNALTKKGKSWAVYGYDSPPLTRSSVADITDAPNANFGEFADFQKAVQSGTLANYVFLEPSWGESGNSQHPNYDVAKGEQFLLQIYNTLFASPVWNDTLLIITYDEHGGCYDHVPPPENATPPDVSAGKFGFKFNRFGPRVPTVLVSPLIEAGTVFRVPNSALNSRRRNRKPPTPFDHTSILATIEKRFGVKPLTARDKAAPDVGGVLTRRKARTDNPLQGVKAPRSKKSGVHKGAPSQLQLAHADMLSDLPHGRGYKRERPEFKSGSEADRYIRRWYREYHEDYWDRECD